MSFFDWNTGSTSPHVSEYFWIYIVLTLCLTGLTVGSWYYVTVYRREHLAKKFDDDDERDVESGLPLSIINRFHQRICSTKR
jgi:hypothetical protein